MPENKKIEFPKKDTENKNILNLQIEKKEILQKDFNKCWDCSKKIGIRGFKCRCNYSFCKKHRMPEEHNCGFDFLKESKRKLSDNIVQVIQEKVEKI